MIAPTLKTLDRLFLDDPYPLAAFANRKPFQLRLDLQSAAQMRWVFAASAKPRHVAMGG